MNKYGMLSEMISTIEKIENYCEDSFTYSHLVGIMSAHLTDEQHEKILAELSRDLSAKEFSDELKYEMEAGK